MILDSLKNSSRYLCMGEDLRVALKYLAEKDFTCMEDGRYEIQGSDIYAVVSRYSTKPLEKSLWESHRRYTDVHYVASGIERIGSAPTARLSVVEDYNDEKDVIMLKGEGDFFTLKEGDFAVFHARECHMPGVIVDYPRSVLKVVVKLKAS